MSDKPTMAPSGISMLVRAVDGSQYGDPGRDAVPSASNEGILFTAVGGVLGGSFEAAAGLLWGRDDMAPNSFGALAVSGLNYAWDETANTIVRIHAGSNASDAIVADAQGNFQSISFNLGFNGATYDRLRVASVANVGSTAGVLQVTGPTQITAENRPASNVAASAALAAPGAGLRNIITGLTVSLAAGATASVIVTASLSDGTTTFWSAKFAAIIGDSKQLDISDCEFPGADNAAMTLAVTAGGATTEVTAALRGYVLS